MFVHPDHQDSAVGKTPAEAVIAEAKAAGDARMLLDTGPKQREAEGPHRRLGFIPARPCHDPWDEMRNWLIFMELKLLD